MINFIVKQRWRIANTYNLIVPIIGILNTSLYALIALGIYEVELTFTKISIGFFGILSIFLALGYILDKMGYFKKDIEKTFNSATMDVYLIQSEWNALLIAKFMKMDANDLDTIIKNHKMMKSYKQ